MISKVTPMSTAPRIDDEDFDDNMDVFLGEIPVLGTEFNVVIDQINAVTAQINADVATVSAHKDAVEQISISAGATVYPDGAPFNFPDTTIGRDGNTYRCLGTDISDINPVGNPSTWKQLTGLSHGPNLFDNSGFEVNGNCTLEAQGSNLVTAWANSGTYPYETFTASGADVTSAVNSSSYGGAVSTINLSPGLHKVVVTLTLNSGAAPQLFTSSNEASGTRDGALDVVLTSGANEFLFQATANDNFLELWNDANSDFSLTLTLHAVSRAYTGADGNAPVGWVKSGAAYPKLYVESSDVSGGGKNAVRMTPVGASGYMRRSMNPDDVRGRTVTLLVKVKASETSHGFIMLQDDNGTIYKYHTGGGAWEPLRITHTFAADITYAIVDFGHVAGSSDVLFCSPMPAIGYVDDDGYAPIPQEIILLDAPIVVQSAATVSANTDIDVFLATEGKIPNSARALGIKAEGSCSVAGTGIYFGKLGEVPMVQQDSNAGQGANGVVQLNNGLLPMTRAQTWASVVITATGVYL